MLARLLLIVVSVFYVGLVWQGEGLAQDKKDGGGKVTSSPKKVTSSDKKSAAPAVKKKVTSGGGGKATAAPASKKKVISGGGSKGTAAPAAPSRVTSGGAGAGAAPKASTGLGGKVTIRKPLPDSTKTLKVEPTEKAGNAPPPDGGGTSTTQSSGSAGLPAATLDENEGGAEGDVVVENVYVTVVDQAGAPNGSVVGSVPPEGNYRQVGDDLYVDEDGDGVADVVYPNTHINANGSIVAGQPDICSVDAVPSGPTFYGRYDPDGEPGADGQDAAPGADDDFANDFNLRQDPDTQGDGIERPRGTARVNLFGRGADSAAPAQPAPAVLPTGDVAQTLGELKSLFDKGLLPDSQYEIMQGQALAALDPGATGIEGGLQLLRDFWDQGLISADPYAVKRKEYLDAL